MWRRRKVSSIHLCLCPSDLLVKDTKRLEGSRSPARYASTMTNISRHRDMSITFLKEHVLLLLSVTSSGADIEDNEHLCKLYLRALLALVICIHAYLSNIDIEK